MKVSFKIRNAPNGARCLDSGLRFQHLLSAARNDESAQIVFGLKPKTNLSSVIPDHRARQCEMRSGIQLWVVLIGLVFFSTSLHATWSVADAGGGTWDATNDAHDQTAQMVVPTDGTSAITLDWQDNVLGVGSSQVLFTYTLTSGAWQWSDGYTESIYNFDNATNTWVLSGGTDTWVYDRGTKTWTQTTGEQAVWSYDQSSGYWVNDPTGSADEWLYHRHSDQWEYIDSSERWTYDDATQDWTTSAGDPTTPVAFPPQALRQHQFIRSILHPFLHNRVVASQVAAGFSVSNVSAGIWAGKNGSEDQSISYNHTTSGLTMTWQNNGDHSHQQGTVAFQHNPVTGDWSWQDNLNPLWARSWQYDAETLVWKDNQNGDQWTYDTQTKTWTSGSISWQYDAATSRWLNNPGGQVWHYDQDTGYLTFDPDGDASPVYQYNLATDTFPEITDTGLGVDPMPPLVIIQKVIIDTIYEKLRLAGAFVDSGPFGWQAVTLADDVWSASNASGKELLKYTPANIGSEITWAAEASNQSFSYNIDTGAWTWTNSFDVDDVQEWTYNSETQRWALDGSSDYWQFTVSTQSWQDKDATITWQYKATTDTWRNSATMVEWLFSPTNNTWTNQTNSAVWRYDLPSRIWHIVSNAPDPLPEASSLPPEALIQHVLIAYGIDHLRQAQAFSTNGLFGITLTAQGEGIWSGDTAAGDERLIYNPTRVPYPIHSRNIGAVVAQQDTLTYEFDIDGDWLVTQAVNSAVPKTTSFSTSTGLWTAADGTTPWQWQAQTVTQWLEAATGRTWTFDNTAKQWTDSVSGHVWSYVAATGIWQNSTNSTAWKYDPLAEVWSQSSGTTMTAQNMPPLPVIQRALWTDVFQTVARSGVFVLVEPLGVTLEDQGGSVWRWHRDDANETLTFSANLAGSNRFAWTTANNIRTWSFDPATGDWQWQTVINGGGLLEWAYDATTRIWKDGGQTTSWQLDSPLIWREVGNQANAWQYNPVSQQWKNLQTNTLWGFFSYVATLPSDDDFVWTNITNSTGWQFNESAQRWVQTAGNPQITTDLPPEPVRQMTLLHIAWQAALASNVFVPTGAFGWTGIERQSDGTWQGTNDAADQAIIFDARIKDYSLYTKQSGFVSWAQEKMKWQYDPVGRWRFCNVLDPFVGQVWGYDQATGDWGRETYTGTAGWSYDATTLIWTHVSAGYKWQYTVETAAWRDVDNLVDWTYSTTTGLWTQGSTTWRYNHMSGTWVQVSGDDATLNMPPRVVVDDEIVRSVVDALRDAGALTEKAQLTWQAGEHTWWAKSSLNNAQAQYDVQQEYQLTWRDTHTQNTMQYNTTTGEWLWRADDQRWWHNAAAGLWGRDTRASSESWLYVADTSWTSVADTAQVWTQGDNANTWTHEPSQAVWVYEPTTNQWVQGETRWLYSFAAGNWFEVSSTRVPLAVMPPLPLIQQQFVIALAASADTFFDNPLYAAARSAPPTQHPLFGSRPLAKQAAFKRYNTSSVLVNADVTLDYVTWVHNDVSRNHGKLQLPSVGTTALPAIIGGDRASLLGEQWAPCINLRNSRIACHESLVSAGVRWCVYEDMLPAVDGSAANAHNSSSIMGYNRGRVYDMALRRGTVFQLGSAANRMADGTIDASILDLGGGVSSTSSMRDAFIDVYRQAPTIGATSDAPTTIDLALQSAQEAGVAAKERAYQMLYMAHRSRIAIGWPTTQGDTGYRPWNVTSAIIDAQVEAEAETLFSASQTGGGSLSIAGNNWYIGGRNSNNAPPKYPVSGLDRDNVLYVEHGGTLQARGAYDLILDTVVARRLGSTSVESGQIVIPADQVSFGPDGVIQPYGIDFSTFAQTTGPLTGHVPLHPGTSEMATGPQLQAVSVEQVK